jgi:hypothetical protein
MTAERVTEAARRVAFNAEAARMAVEARAAADAAALRARELCARADASETRRARKSARPLV